MNRGRGGGRGGSAGGRGGRSNNAPSTKVQEEDKTVKAEELEGTAAVGEAEVKAAAKAEDVDESRICWICAEPVKYFSVSECNHRTCHVCALRLRALYKKLDCTFCKVRISCSQLHTRGDLFSTLR